MPYGVVVFARALLSRYSSAPVAAQAQPMNPICYVKPAATIAGLNGYTVCPEGEGIPVYARAQQPVSGADRLPLTRHDLNTSAGGRGFVAEYFESRVGRYDFTRYIRDRLAADFACALAAHLSQLSGIPGQLDHLPDATKMVPADQFRDAAQMIEPSGNIGDLDAPVETLRMMRGEYDPKNGPMSALKAKALDTAIAALAQQDADIEAAAKTLAECMNYPWEPMPEQGRDAMRKHAKDIIDAARKEPDQ